MAMLLIIRQEGMEMHRGTHDEIRTMYMERVKEVFPAHSPESRKEMNHTVAVFRYSNAEQLLEGHCILGGL